MVPGKVNGVFHPDLRWFILSGAMTKWYKSHKLWDKIVRIRVFNEGHTISVRIKKGAKHTWREIPPGVTVKVGRKIAAVIRYWSLVITDDRETKEKKCRTGYSGHN